MQDQDPIILTDKSPAVEIEPFSRLWRKIRRSMRKKHYTPGQGKGAPVSTGEVVTFKGGFKNERIMVKFSDGSLRKSQDYTVNLS